MIFLEPKMIEFSTSESDDLLQILEWMTADPYHYHQVEISGPQWWLTGTDCLLAGCVSDEGGPVFYFRLDKDGELIRLHIQFAPENQVPKRRIAKGIVDAIPVWKIYAQSLEGKGLVFESTNPSLIKFGEKLGFKQHPEFPNDYVLDFKE